MIKPKSIIICVCVGFVLSFVVGLLAGVSFGVILLRAIVFGVLFGVLGFGVGLVCQRFLLEGPDLEGDTPTVSRQGSVVDLTIGDEPLEEDENGPDFYVRSDVSYQEAEEGKSSEKEEVSLETPANGGEAGTVEIASESSAPGQFKPISLGVPAQGPAAPVSNRTSGSEDVLPEIGDIPIASSDDSDELTSEGMDLAIGNGMETSQRRGGADMPSDSNTIAQAIRTVLAQDS